MQRFVKKLAIFLISLAALTGLTDRLIGQFADNSPLGYPALIGGDDVHLAVYQSNLPGPKVRTIYVGDSVSRQLFTPGAELTTTVRYLSSNYAISMAGQYFLLQRAIQSCPNVREVDLFYLPASWGNDLPRVLSHDYFCGYFHSPGEVAETFAVTGDWDLAAAHVGRFLLPNLLAANSASHAVQLAPPAGAEAGPARVQTPDPEPLLASLTAVTRYQWTPNQTLDTTPEAMPFSNVSRVFLQKMRTLCQRRGIRLRILPSPSSDARRYRVPPGLYEGPVLYFEADKFVDGIHFRKQWIDDARRRVTDAFELAPDQ